MVLATVGLDHLISRGVTMAAEIVGEFQVGDSRLKLPRPVNYDAPFHRVVNTTAIPDIRDDLINGSFGVKYSAANRMTVVANALVPLNDGGLRARVTYTMGLSYAY